MRTQLVVDKFFKHEKAKGSSCKSTGDKLYSYNTVIAQWLPTGDLIGNVTKYSHTTSVLQNNANVKEADIIVRDVPTGTQDLKELK